MQKVMIAVFALGFAACAQGEGESTTPPAHEAEAGAETPVEAAPDGEAEPTCGRNSSEICECAEGGSGLRVCLEGTWADCACEEGGFDDNDDLAFDDE
ncbi:MAG: hypothetical protein ACI9KE_004183 [Polyangiales bacterium]|jgi:hypothetical protein